MVPKEFNRSIASDWGAEGPPVELVLAAHPTVAWKNDLLIFRLHVPHYTKLLGTAFVIHMYHN